MRTIIETLEFLEEEVIVIKKTELTGGGTSAHKAFEQTVVNQEKGQLIKCTVIKVGVNQQKIKEGDDIYVKEDYLSEIKIKGNFQYKDIFVLPNHKIIFAKC